MFKFTCKNVTYVTLETILYAKHKLPNLSLFDQNTASYDKFDHNSSVFSQPCFQTATCQERNMKMLDAWSVLWLTASVGTE